MTREWREFVLPIGRGFHTHDVWINGLAHRLKVARIVPVPLQLYRRHGGNASSWEFSNPRWQKRRSAHAVLSNFKSILANKLGGELQRSRSTLDRLRRGKEKYSRLAQEAHWNTAIKWAEAQFELVKSRKEICDKPRFSRLRPIVHMLRTGRYNSRKGVLSAIKDFVRVRDGRAGNR
jgi:hypothetical protein